jgi:enolase
MPQIANVAAREILDSRGSWTIEAHVWLYSGVYARASVPQGKSTGTHEVPMRSPADAVRIVRDMVQPALRDTHFVDIADIDERLREIDGTDTFQEIGGNTALALSVAVARAASREAGVPLYSYLEQVCDTSPDAFSPICYMNMINGGAHAGSGLPVQEYLIGVSGPTIRSTLVRGTVLYRALKEHLEQHGAVGDINVGDEGGFAPAMDDVFQPLSTFSEVARSCDLTEYVTFGIDAAANTAVADEEQLRQRYEQMVDEYGVSYIEDPFHEESFDVWASLRQSVQGRAYVVGDDLTTTSPTRITKARSTGAANGIIVKPNQIGVLTTAISVAKRARQFGWHVVVSHRSGDTCDDWIADVAAAVGADGVKFGAPARSERTSKYNRLLAIENLYDARGEDV